VKCFWIMEREYTPDNPGEDVTPDAFIELIPYQETRGYTRSVLRNRDLYRALYTRPSD